MEKKELKKNLGVFPAMSIVVGCVIGAGVFFKPCAIYNYTGGKEGMGILAWVAGGLISLLGALTFTEVAVRIPKTGGMVSYLTDVYSEKIGFLAGWMQVVIFYPAYLAGYGVKVGSELATYFGKEMKLPIAMMVIIALVFINILGNKSAGGMQVAATICKLIPLVLIMVFGFIYGKSDINLMPLVADDKSFSSALGGTLLAVLFAFEGWTNVGSIAGEMKNPGKDLPKAIVGGVSIIMAVYLIINFAYIKVIPAEQLMMIESPAAAVAQILFGSAGGTIIKIGIVISVIGAGNGFLMAGSRVCYQLAKKKLLPKSESLSSLNNNSVPTGSIVLIGFLACIYSLSGEFDLLTDLGTLSCWIFYTLTFTCIFKLRKTGGEGLYKVPGYPVVPILAVLSGLYVVVSQFLWSGIYGLRISICSIAFTLLGLPIYFLVKKRNSKE